MNKKNIILNIIKIITIIVSFLILDIGLRYITYSDFKFFLYSNYSPLGFSLSWIIIFIGLIFFLTPKKQNIIYLISLLISIIITYSQYLHFIILNKFYSINDIFLLNESSSYFKYAISKTSIKILIVILISISLSLISVFINSKIKYKKYDKLDKIFILFILVIAFLGFYTSAYFQLGKVEDSYNSSKNVYKEFSDPTKTLQVTGIYENLYHGIFIYIKDKLINNTKEQLQEINSYQNTNKKEKQSNEYSKIFENKNVIYILMESLDTFLINNETMPTLYKLQQEGFNFTNRYSPAFGEGQTINTEFATNTGLYTSNKNNIYDLKNTYKTSLANKFASLGYEVNSLHFNNGYYYNRKYFHTNLGYNNHYALKDMDLDNNKYNYEYDSNLIKNKNVYDLIVKDNKFLTYITTYSTHLPYPNDRCKTNKYNYKATDTELVCIKNLAKDTDEMIRLLIENLNNDNKLNDTVLIFVADHYMYGYSYIDKIKEEDNEYLLQNTPFIIWSNNIEHKDIDILLDTADILPTIFNMFNIDYDPNLYIGEDIFSQERDNYIYFNEDTYYDGNTLYDINNKSTNSYIYNQIKEQINYNNYLIDTNYLKK